MARNHIRNLNLNKLDFATGYPEDNVISGMRFSCDIMIEINLPLALKDGYEFYVSKNGVILSKGQGSDGCIPPAYFKRVFRKEFGKEKEEIDLSPFENLLILDFEANCIKDGKLNCQEIIEFPIIPINVQSLDISDNNFHYYIKPTVHTEITDFCTELTGITQDTVNSGIKLEEALEKLEIWMQKNGFNEQNSIFVTCGRWDLNSCLKNEAIYKNLNYPNYLKRYINIKDIWCQVMFKNKSAGMKGMLDSFNLKLEGRHHSGIDDSKNIAKIAVELLKRRGTFTNAQVLLVKN